MDDKPGAPPAEDGDIEIGSKTLGGANQFGWGGGGGQGGVGGYPRQGNVSGYPPQGGVGGYPPQGSVGGFPPQGNVGGYPPQGGFGGGSMPPFMPGNPRYPPGSGAPPPYQGTAPSLPSYGYGNQFPPTSAQPAFHNPAGAPVGIGPNGSGMYPQLGFNPALLTTSQAYMECPICMEVLMKPIYQCSNGHIICNTCIERSQFCGQCRVPLAGPRIRNVALEQITETMEVKCPNHLDGCETIAMGEQLKRHLEVCDFRAVNICSKFLGFSDCKDKVTTVVAPVHLREVHQAEIKESSKFAMRLIAKSPVFESMSGGEAVSWGPIVITSAFDSDIVLKCHTTPQGQLSITGYLIGCTEESHKLYRVKFQLDSQRSRLEWTGGLLSIRHHNIADHLLNQNTFQVPLQSLKEFVKPHHDQVDNLQDQSKLRVKVALWKLSDGDNKPYKECFTTLETGEKVPIEKVILQSKPYTGTSSISAPSQSAFPISQPASVPAMSVPSYPSSAETSYGGYPAGRDFTSTNSSSYPYPSGNNCRNCNQALFGVFYQCLQCPEGTFYCQRCIEQARAHSNHLTLRISSLDQQPLASVVYECAAEELN